jgi:putative transcriptional regulator
MVVTTMREFDALCLLPVKRYSAGQIKKLWLRCKASHAVFAAYLNNQPVDRAEMGAGQKVTEWAVAEIAR